MVEVGTTCRRVEDAPGVLLEDGSVSLDEDRDWLLGDSCLHLIDIICLHSLVVGDVGGGCLNSGLLAGAIPGGVWVAGLFIGHVVLPVVEGVLLPTTTAAVVTISSRDSSAVNELLLCEAGKFASLDEMRTLKGSSGGEGPA